MSAWILDVTTDNEEKTPRGRQSALNKVIIIRPEEGEESCFIL